jgi:hypothetical protein
MEDSEGSEEVERRVDSQVVSRERRGMCNIAGQQAKLKAAV